MKKIIEKTGMLISLGVGLASAAMADDVQEVDASLALEEVIVTAQKREQNLQDTPISITAYDRQAIEDQNVHDISDVGFATPNIQIAESPGGSTGATIAMRGSVTVNPAVTWEPTVGIYMDGVFIAKNVGGLFDVAELDRIEVLRGPQGTLYGKNTVGGAINLITRKPGEEFSGKLKMGVGNYNLGEASLSVDTGKIADVASFNVAINKRERDGLFENDSVDPSSANRFKELDASAARIAGLFDISDQVELYYTYDVSEKDNTPSFGQAEFGGGPGFLSAPDVDRADSGTLDGAKFDTSESEGHALTLTYDALDNLTFKSITAYREMSFDDSNDYDGFDMPGFHTERHVRHDQSSQEFQFSGNADAVNYVAGLFFMNENANAYNPFTIGALGPIGFIRNFYEVESTSYALFGQADFLITDKLTITSGLRWTTEEKDSVVSHPDFGSAFLTGAAVPPDFAGVFVNAKGNETWSNVSPMAVFSYAWTEALTTYVKLSQGWKAGGFNGESATAAIAATPYDEETVNSLELGIKSRWFDDRLQANIALFNNNISNMQLSEFLGAYSQIHNAGEATINGLEIEGLFAITESLTATFNYGLLSAEYDDFVINGVQTKDQARFPYTPRNKYSAGLEYNTSLSLAQLRARIDWAHRSKQYAYHDRASASLTEVEEYDLLNARVGLVDIAVGGDNTMEVGIWGDNLTDEEYRINGIPFTTSFYAINYYGDPRTVGVDVTFNF